MAFLYLDTSSFVKLYLAEKGSRWIRNFVKGNQIIISELTLAETTSVFTKLFRDGTLTRRKATRTLAIINRQSANFIIVPVRIREQLGKLSSLGFSLPAHLRLRTLDSIQLLGAESAKNNIISQDPAATFIFVSSDVQLLRVAQARGFTTENPENYP